MSDSRRVTTVDDGTLVYRLMQKEGFGPMSEPREMPTYCLCGLPAVATRPVLVEGFSLPVCERHSAWLSDNDAESIGTLSATVTYLLATVNQLRGESAEAMKVLAPNVPESGLVDACRQVKQVAISEADNSEKLEAALAAMTRFTPTPNNINALPDRLRSYIHDLETRSDPAGDRRQLVFARDALAAMTCAKESWKAQTAVEVEKALAAMTRELDEWIEREAACCPEDVGFPEYIRSLEKKLAELREQIAALPRHRVHVQHEDNDPVKAIQYVACPPDPVGPWVSASALAALIPKERSDDVERALAEPAQEKE